MGRVRVWAAAVSASAVTAAGMAVLQGPGLAPVGGAVRATGGWHVLSDDAHETVDLTGVTCSGNTLTVFFPTAQKVVTFSVEEDETLSREYRAGPSVGTGPGAIDRAVVFIYNRAGDIVPCAQLTSINNANFWISGLVVPL